MGVRVNMIENQPADDLIRRIRPEKLQGGRIQILKAAAGMAEDGNGRMLDHHAEVFFALPQGFFGDLALRDIFQAALVVKGAPFARPAR